MFNTIKTTAKIISVIFFALAGYQGYSQHTPVVIKKALEGSKGQIQVDSFVQVDNFNFYDTAYSNHLSGTHTVKNVVTFKIDEASDIYLGDTFAVDLSVRIIYTNISNNTDSIDKTFSISYGRLSRYNARKSFVFYGGQRVIAKILSYSLNTNSGNDPDSIPTALMLENEMMVQADYDFTCSGSVITTITGSDSSVSNPDELHVSWPFVFGADEYDLEWTYIDSSAINNYVYGNPLDPDRAFDNNATRITTSDLSYSIPLMYDNGGALYYRVRPVKIKQDNYRVEANWSSDYSGGLGEYGFRGHERNLNWQSSISFAEDGKRKVVVQYFDGSLRSRQTVTKDNTSNKTIVAETFYDFQGRPAIQVLPAPTLNTVIKYTSYFNIGINTPEYDKFRYDTLASASTYCTSGAEPMKTTTGASKYYSPSNPEVANRFNQYIPDAEGYPFTQTEYTQDNTGRISKQSGVGPTFRIGSNHETKYFYGLPDQKELDALFGTEVGNYSHYFKTMVRDANGQYSVSYTDMHGRTIATALAGTPSDSSGLELLDSHNETSITENISDPNSVIIKDMIMEHKKSLTVEKAGNHVFNYSLSPQSLVKPGCDTTSFCYDCLYDLRITISGDCNNQGLPGGKRFDTTLRNFSPTSIDTTCSNAAQGFSFSFTLSLAEGSYDITKQLSVSRFGMNYYRDSVFLKRNTCKTLQQFIDEQKAIVASKLDCEPSCKKCMDSLGSWDTFRVKFMTGAGILTADTASYRGQAWSSYLSASEACKTLCDSLSETDDIRHAMLLDMMAPSGQYADTSKVDKYSIFYSADFETTKPPFQRDTTYYKNEAGADDYVYNNATGLYVKPNTLDTLEFYNSFKTVWAEALLKYHPEYCKLVNYEIYNASHFWDRNKFEGEYTFRSALNKGYLNPTGSVSAPFSHFPANATYEDPITNWSDLQNSIEDKVANYQHKDISMWSMACIMVLCGPGNTACYSDYSDVNNCFDSTVMCEADLNMAWEYFKEMYIQEKRKIMDSVLNADCSSPTYATSTELVNAGHYPNFNSAADAMTQNGLGTMQTGTSGDIIDSANDAADAFYQTNCNRYVQEWIKTLKACNYSKEDLDGIIVPRLVQVCKEGSDVSHPFGSSTISPSSTYTFHSFQEVLDYYNDSVGKTRTCDCNPELITKPRPYYLQAGYASKPITDKPDSCECEKINALYNQYQAEATDTSFSAFIYRVKHVTMTEDDLDQLLASCNTSTDCKNLLNVIMLPPQLQCYTADVCIPCRQVDSIYGLYKLEYADFMPNYNELDTCNNRLFANFMNNRLGMGKTAIEYLQFMYQCGIDPLVTSSHLCNDLEELSSIFLEYYDGLPDPKASKAVLFTTYFNNHYHSSYSLEEIRTIWGVACEMPCMMQKVLGAGDCALFDDCELLEQLLQQFGESYSGPDFQMSIRGAFAIYFNEYFASNFTVAQIDSILFHNCEVHFDDYDAYVSDPVIDCSTLESVITDFENYYKDLTYPFPNHGLGFVQYFNQVFGTTYSYYQLDSLVAVICEKSLGGDYKIYEITPTDCPTLTDFSNQFDTYYASLDPQPLCTETFENAFNIYFGTNYNFFQIDSIYYLHCESHLSICGDELIVEGSAVDWCIVMSHLISDFPAYYDGLSEPKPTKNQAFTDFFNEDNTANSYHWSPSLDFTTLAYMYARICNGILNFPEDPDYPDSLQLCGYLNPIFDEIPVDDISNCSDSTFFAVSVGTELYNSYQDSLKYAFDTAYLDKCMQAYKYETFTVTRTMSLYHYTLYYYDQGGNLVKTVPPEGVSPDFGSTWLTNVKNARAAGTDLPNTNHTLVTQYRYNTLNQVVAQITPDAGRSNFWYDELGRLILSQNAKQYDNDQFSYTLYDAIGRIKEVGQIESASESSLSPGAFVMLTYGDFESNVEMANRTQITRTVYDEDYDPLEPVMAATNLRNRVAWTAYYVDSDSLNNDSHQSATFYTYDIHGNVDTLVQDYRIGIMAEYGNRFKKMVYQYDLVSGKVNHVAYQPNMPDAFYHRYSYDAENKLVNAETSSDSVNWDNDAYYEYYRHGPLARTVIGQQEVQGVDYAYTLQGWLKGVNGPIHLSKPYEHSIDMGRDGVPNESKVAKDVYSFSLYYYGDRDYTPINASGMLDVNYPFAQIDGFMSYHRPLFNGNISGMSTDIPIIGDPLFNAYRYDQLNRLIGMDVYNGFDKGANSWSSAAFIDDFMERISYDANGNIKTYYRNGNSSSIDMDDLRYNYNPGTNQLNQIEDYMSSSYSVDIDNQSADNYTYDEIGNLITDAAEGIANIDWSVYGKIDHIQNSVGDIYYTYDAAGNRISKKMEGEDRRLYTWYVRDASGNVMAVYIKGAGIMGPQDLTNSEAHIYGSSRLGIMQREVNVEAPVAPDLTSMSGLDSMGYDVDFIRGNKLYELTNHLGNVLVTITDKNMGHDDGTGHIDYYEADVATANEYYPFGMLQPGRSYTNGNQYRYGFNGKEKDDEVKGEGAQYDYGFRIYDNRIGRFLSVDPLFRSYPWNSPYSYAENDVIGSIDLDGLEKYVVTNYRDGHGDITKTCISVLKKNGTEAITNLHLVTATNAPITTKDVLVRDVAKSGKTTYQRKSNLDLREQNIYNSTKPTLIKGDAVGTGFFTGRSQDKAVPDVDKGEHLHTQTENYTDQYTLENRESNVPKLVGTPEASMKIDDLQSAFTPIGTQYGIKDPAPDIPDNGIAHTTSPAVEMFVAPVVSKISQLATKIIMDPNVKSVNITVSGTMESSSFSSASNNYAAYMNGLNRVANQIKKWLIKQGVSPKLININTSINSTTTQSGNYSGVINVN